MEGEAGLGVGRESVVKEDLAFHCLSHPGGIDHVIVEAEMEGEVAGLADGESHKDWQGGKDGDDQREDSRELADFTGVVFGSFLGQVVTLPFEATGGSRVALESFEDVGEFSRLTRSVAGVDA